MINKHEKIVCGCLLDWHQSYWLKVFTVLKQQTVHDCRGRCGGCALSVHMKNLPSTCRPPYAAVSAIKEIVK